jgi:nucleoside-diphosphate-sugar epimerase
MKILIVFNNFAFTRGIMKISITGHTKGIGLAFANLYQQKNYLVNGFSRSNGFDITNPDAVDQIINQSQDADIFINNAHSWNQDAFAQTNLLFQLWESWQGKEKIIVNIGSSLTMRWEKGPSDSIIYRTAKKTLEESCDFLWNQNAWPYVCLMVPCLTDTARTRHRNDTNKVDPQHFVNLVDHCLSIKEFRIPVVKLAVNPLQ